MPPQRPPITGAPFSDLGATWYSLDTSSQDWLGFNAGGTGFGGDVLLSEGRLRFSADLFGSFQRTPRLKVAASFAVLRSIFVVAGIDDALNTPGYLSVVPGNTPLPNDFTKVRYGRDYFAGLSLHFTDAALSMLLRFYGALILGLI